MAEEGSRGTLPPGFNRKTNTSEEKRPPIGQEKSGSSGLLSLDRLKRLRNAKAASWKKLEPFRSNMVEAVKQLVGKAYSDDGARDEIPVNLIDLGATTYVAQLAARAPRALVTTKHLPLKPVASDFELALNHQIKLMGLESTLKKVVMNALFGLGVVKVGLATSDQVEADGFLHDPGQVFVDTVDMHDLVFDMEAKRWDQISFIGDRYTMPLDFLKESEDYDPAVTAQLERDKVEDRAHASGDDAADAGSNSEHIDRISRGSAIQDSQFYDEVELWDIWLPYEGLVVTIAGRQDSLPPLRVVEWEGPEHGPYHMLRFQEVPGQVMPMPPVGHWVELHKLMNSIWRKLGRQAHRQKTYYMYQGAGEEDARRVRDADDGEMIRKDSPHPVEEVSLKGPDGTLVSLASMVRDLFSYLGGNIDALGGLSAQAETLGAEKLIAASASKRVSELTHLTIQFVRGVVEDVGLYIWTDPLVEYALNKRVPGTDIEIPIVWSPETREGAFPSYDIEIDPYSMSDRTPQGELQKVQGFVQQFLIPLQPMMEAQGMAINLEALFRLVAKYTNMEDLDQLVVFAGEPQYPRPQQVGTTPASTHRVVERINRPGASQEGKGAAIQQILGQGNRLQPKEAAQLTRPVG